MAYYTKNPYKHAKGQRQAMIYAPSDYNLSLITSVLSPIALRVLVVMAAKVDASGIVSLHHDDLARVIQTSRTYVGVGVAMLLKYELIARHKKGQYWLSPALFRPLLIDC